jgi:hypothetical protein
MVYFHVTLYVAAMLYIASSTLASPISIRYYFLFYPTHIIRLIVVGNRSVDIPVSAATSQTATSQTATSQTRPPASSNEQNAITHARDNAGGKDKSNDRDPKRYHPYRKGKAGHVVLLVSY